MKKLLLTLLAFMVTMAMSAGDFVSGGIVYNSTITDNDDGSRTFKLVLKDGSAAEGEVVIPEKLLVDGVNELTLTAIGASAFENNTKITRVVIPDCVSEMGSSAFAGCTNLTSIDLPANLETIPLRAFFGCTKLESVTVKNSFTGGIDDRGVGDEAFKNCKSLKSIDLSKGAEQLGISAFEGCSSLEYINLPENSLKTIWGSCFRNCTSLEYIHVPSTVTCIEDYFCAGCTGLKWAQIDPGEKTFWGGDNYFLGCTSLTTATIGWYGELPASLFKGCTNLKSVQLVGGITGVKSEAFYGCTSLESVSWPDRIEFISDSVFKDCKALEYIKIPQSVNSFGQAAFFGCSSLKEIVIPEGVKELPWGLFEDCTQLEHVSLPESLTTINEKAFWRCRSLKSLKLPGQLTTIKASAFAMCNSLTSLSFPSTLTSLGTSSFYHCYALQLLDFRACTGLKIKDTRRDDKESLVFRTVPEETVILMPGDELPAGMGEGYAVFDENTATLTFKYEIAAPEGLNVFKNIDDAQWCWNIDMSQLKKVVFDSSFANARPKSTASWFESATSLTEITGLQYLNTNEVISMEGMFSNCSSLTSLDLSSFDTGSVTNMGRMFLWCNRLSRIFVGSGWNTKNVNSSELMFCDCANLTGGLGTGWNPSYIDKAFAHIDSESSPGYFCDIKDKSKIEALGYSVGYAIFDEATATLTFKYGECPAGDYVYRINTWNEDSPWPIWDRAQIKKVVFDASFANARPKYTSHWFENATSLTEITGLQYLNTSEVTSMEGMFSDCGSLTSLDLSSFDTGSVTNMGWMFNNCNSLKSLNLSSFNTSNVENMDWMFAWCTSLSRIFVGDGWNTGNVTSSEMMFGECKNLIGGSGTEWYSSHVDMVYAHIDSESSPGYLCDIKDKSQIDALGNPVGYAIFDEATGTLTFKYGDFPAGDHVYRAGNPWDAESSWDRSQLKKVIFDPSFAKARPMSTSEWFGSAESLTEIVGIQYLNTSHVTNMSFMFSGCNALTSLDLSNFNTSNVTNMMEMFGGCWNLTSLDVSNFDTGKVTDMSGMFGNVSLQVLDLSSFDTRNVTNMDNMFGLCWQSLKTIYVGDNWSTQNVTSCENMFEGCKWLIGGLGTTFDENHIDDAYARIDGGKSLPGYFTSSSERDLGYQALGYAVFDESTGALTFKYGEKPLGEYVFDTDNTNFGLSPSSDLTEMTPWAKLPITKVVFDPSYANAHPKSTSWWFSYSSADGDEWGNSITEFVGLEYLNTSYVKDMSYMFGCPNITNLDVSHFNTSNVINMHAMFAGCTSLTSLDVSNFDTGKVRKMTAMFSSCESLESLDVSHFNTNNVYDMWGMFRRCLSLKSIDVSHFDTRNVTNMAELFYACIGLTNIDVGNFDTSNVTNISGMFWGCSGLKTIDLSHLDTRKVTKMSEMFMLCTGMTHLDLSNFDTSNVDSEEGFEYMFYGCMDLTSLNLSSFNTSKVQSLYCAFMGCESLKEIDLSNFDTGKVRAMAFMFHSCKSLQTIYVGEKWNTGSLTHPEDNLMFVDCNQLVGSKGTRYDANHTDTEYAHVDGGSGAPGYFTLAYMDDGISYLPSDDGSLQLRNATCKEVVDIPSSLYVEGQVKLVEGIRNEAFMDNTNLIIVSIPESVERIGTSAFAGCSGLKIIYCYATDPIALGSANARVFTRAGEEVALSVFEGVDRNSCILYVPKGCAEKYKSATGWREFAHIEEMPSNVKGDVNGDGVLDDKDLKAVVDHIIGKTPEGSFDVNVADINKDNKVNAADIVFIVKLIGQK